MAVRITRTNAIDLFRAMADSNYRVAKIFEEDGDEAMAKAFKDEAFAMYNAADLLKSPQYFNKQWENYKDRIEEARKKAAEAEKFEKQVNEALTAEA